MLIKIFLKLFIAEIIVSTLFFRFRCFIRNMLKWLQKKCECNMKKALFDNRVLSLTALVNFWNESVRILIVNLRDRDILRDVDDSRGDDVC